MMEATEVLPSMRELKEPLWSVERGGASKRGTGHSRNEDCAAFGSKSLSYALFDGIGGSPFGDIASRVGANVAVDSYDSGMTLRASMMESKRAVESVRKWLHSEDMGCTALMAVVEGDTLRVAWTGDTIAILIRDNKTAILTEPDRTEFGNALSGCFGAGVEREHHECSTILQDGDTVILCTDGVWSLVDLPIIASVSSAEISAPEIAYNLVYKIARDGQDDASAIVLLFAMPPDKQMNAMDSLS